MVGSAVRKTQLAGAILEGATLNNTNGVPSISRSTQPSVAVRGTSTSKTSSFVLTLHRGSNNSLSRSPRLALCKSRNLTLSSESLVIPFIISQLSCHWFCKVFWWSSPKVRSLMLLRCAGEIWRAKMDSESGVSKSKAFNS
jgi:hypothetical protein